MCFAGGIAGKLFAPSALTLSAAAGVLVWIGGAHLAYALVWSPHTHMAETLLAAAAGACAAVLTHRSLMSQARGAAAAEGAAKEKRDVESQGKMPNGGDAGEWDVVDQPGRWGTLPDILGSIFFC